MSGSLFSQETAKRHATFGPRPSTFEPVKTARAFEEIASQVRARFVRGDLTAGQRLPSEREMALQLGVSRNTVREALRSLEMSGVIQMQKGAAGGAFLIPPRGDQIGIALDDMYQLGTLSAAQLTEARTSLEAPVVRLACRRWTNDQLQTLEANVEAAAVQSKAGNLLKRSAINLEFHNLLAQATGNPALIALVRGMIEVMRSFMDKLGPPETNFVRPSRLRFMKHLRERNEEACVAEMERLLKKVHDHYLARSRDAE